MKEEANYNFAVKDRWGKTPIDEAKEQGNVVIMELLGVEPPAQKKPSLQWKLQKEESLNALKEEMKRPQAIEEWNSDYDSTENLSHDQERPSDDTK